MVLDNCPELRNLRNNLQHLADAAAVSVNEMSTKLRDFEKGLHNVDAEISKNHAEHGEDRFEVVMTDFYNEAAEKTEEFSDLLDETLPQFKSLLTFLGEDTPEDPKVSGHSLDRGDAGNVGS